MSSRNSSGRRAVARAGVAWLVMMASLTSAETTPPADPLHPSLRACAGLKDDLERLACYDRAVARLASGSAADQVSGTPQEMFGMDPTLSREATTGGPVKREELPEITAQVTNLGKTANGMALIELDNGQIWQPTEEKRALVLRVGDTVTISRAALGTFRLATADKRSTKVKRVR